MQSKATTVDAYLGELAPERRAACERLRALSRAVHGDAIEAMAYGMPVLERDGAMVVAYASQKNHVALYGLDEATVERFRPRLRGVDFGKGCIRFRDPAAIDFALVEAMMVDARDRAAGRA